MGQGGGSWHGFHKRLLLLSANLTRSNIMLDLFSDLQSSKSVLLPSCLHILRVSLHRALSTSQTSRADLLTPQFLSSLSMSSPKPNTTKERLKFDHVYRPAKAHRRAAHMDT